MATTEDTRSDDIAKRGTYPVPPVRDAHDASDHSALQHNPGDEGAQLDIAFDESFPTSDAPGHSRPGTSDPAPSSGYDDKAEAAILLRRKRKAVALSASKLGVPLIVASASIGYVGFRLVSVTRNEVPNDQDTLGVGA